MFQHTVSFLVTSQNPADWDEYFYLDERTSTISVKKSLNLAPSDVYSVSDRQHTSVLAPITF